MSYWSFSDVFEEQGVVKTPFYGGYGLIAEDGIPKPAFNVFKLLHKLGDQRLNLDSNSALLTRRKDGSLVIVLWNYAAPGQAGTPRTFTLKMKGTKAKHAVISLLDHDHGDFHSAYDKMGAPRYPTPRQIEELRHASDLPPPESRKIKDQQFTITVAPQGLALIELN
jgi:xylan 1,4-beta-xylosidase